MGLTIGLWFIAFVGVALVIWANSLLKEQEERHKALKESKK
ncbi:MULTISPECIES: hypothetical protein [Ursidibacter]|nr:hypothetical protein [Ursidibacter maritimus]